MNFSLKPGPGILAYALRLSVLVGIAVLAVYIQTVDASVYCNTDCGLSLDPVGGGVSTDINVVDLIVRIIEFLLNFVLILAVLAIIVAGFYLILSNGDEGQKDKAKTIVLYVVIGLLLILLARVIVLFVNNLL